MIKKNIDFRIYKLIKVNFYILILSIIYSCNSEVNINSINQNQLNKETSLYLKQHAQNPINWQRWSNSIFDVSQELDKLIVVSIGYSSCHWCHVMAHESFEDNEEFGIPDVSGVEMVPARVKWFDKSKGFGFANVYQSDEDIFLHMEILRHFGFSDLQAGEAIVLQVVDGPRGKMAGAVHSWDNIA